MTLLTLSELVGILVGSATLLYGFVRAAFGLYKACARISKTLDAIERVEHLTTYHLGPNSGAPAIHERITQLERHLSP